MEGKRLMVATIHLSAQWRMPDIALMQAMYFLTRLSEFHKNYNKPPILLCGDLNSTADSSVVELILRRSVPASHPDLQVTNNNGTAASDIALLFTGKC
eukprot:TRINITY_DN5853_c0_g1_i1.p1 TRINITY_DN5853_c0_g1~~TRINITY_DN5853_c0_g1_i1.p1  ORF type:complete len:98 (-),score=6.32 TRINITY_DN5853_c0_g1_i1:204-497(-)